MIHVDVLKIDTEPSRVLKAVENAYCKLSGMVTEADSSNGLISDIEPYVRHVVECFGPERVMFGSDWPVCCLAAGYSQVWAVLDYALRDLSESDRRTVYGENANRFYRLTIPNETPSQRGEK